MGRLEFPLATSNHSRFHPHNNTHEDLGKLMDFAIGGLTIAPIAVIAFIMAALVNIVFAIGVSTDAKKLQPDRPLWFAGRFMWFIATLFGGVTVAAIYWLMHRSTLNGNMNNSK